MAKRQRNHQITSAFHYLVKSMPGENENDPPLEDGFSRAEFARVVTRLSNTAILDDNDDAVIARIKAGEDLPFNHFREVEPGLIFGDFEGAYYGQQYRNNRLGLIEADTLNLRGFHYVIAHLRDGKILVGTTYHGQFGDYDGLRSCLSHLLSGNYRVASKALKSVSAEVGSGRPVSLKLTYRRQNDRPERRPLFGTSGVIAIRSGDYGDEFDDRIAEVAGQIRGTDAERKRILARIVNEGNLLEIDEQDIVGCSAVIRENGRERTIYFIGDNIFASKFNLDVEINEVGLANREDICREMVRVMREHVIPLLS